MEVRPLDRRSLVNLHRALWLGCALFAVTCLTLHFTGTVPLHPHLPTELHWIGLLLAAVLVPVAFAVLRSLLVRVGEDFEVGAVARRVHAACLMHWAVIEGAVFINLTIFLLIGSWLAFATGVATVVVLALRAPKDEAYARWLSGRP